jgi:hypothetical protein
MNADDASSRRVRGAAVVGISTLLFIVHATTYGWWIIDDAGISFAYAFNAADGHGLVAQPGASPVEGFSNPLLVMLFAVLAGLGVVNRGDLASVSDYVLVAKVLAVAFHAMVAAAVVSMVRSIAETRAERCARRSMPVVWAVDIAALTAGVLLAAFPPYVIWMVSGLENPMYAAGVAGLSAVVARGAQTGRVTALPTVIAVGLLAGATTLTRPDGIVYLLALPVLAVMDRSRPSARVVGRLVPGLLAAAAVVLPYVLVRRVVFGRWLPNTATAKAQPLPTVGDLSRVADVPASFGWVFTAVAIGGSAAALIAPRRFHLRRRPLAAVWVFVVLAAVAYAVLAPDWMPEMRFATPAWPLLATLVAVGAVALADLVLEGRAATRRVVPAVAVAVVIIVGWSWRDRALAFRARPTAPLCDVAERTGIWYAVAADELGMHRASVSLLAPDLGGALLASPLEVIDLAGLTDEEIARSLHDGDRQALTDYVLEVRRPTFVRVHSYWIEASGLVADPRFTRDYVALLGTTDYVRRDAVQTQDLAFAVERLGRLDREAGHRAETEPTRACPHVLAAGGR